MEGADIPFGEFQFRTLNDFLYASNEFHLSRSRGGLYIRARLKPHSKHIVNMVSEQRIKVAKLQKPQKVISKASSFLLEANLKIKKKTT